MDSIVTRSKTSTRPKPTPPDGPAVVTHLHVQNRVIDKAVGSPLGWSVIQPWEEAEAKGRLRKGSATHSPHERAQAWRQYSDLWEQRYPAGRDSSQGLNVSRSGNSADSLAASQITAMQVLQALEAHLSQRDAIIVKMVCGQGCFPSEAVAMVGDGYRYVIWARFCEALDSLIEAFSEARRR